MKILLALLLCVPANAAPIADLELLREISADAGAPAEDLPPTPVAHAAPATRVFEGLGTPDGPKRLFWLANGPAAGSRAWVKGEVNGGVLSVSEAVVFPKGKSAQQLPAKAESASLAAELLQVSPWCDHMPMMGEGERRQYLVVKAKLTNKTDKPLVILLAHAFLSFDAKSEGEKVDGLSIRASNDRPGGLTALSLDPGQTRKLELRGDNLYPEGRHGQKLYLTLHLSAGAEELFLRGSGEILATQ